MGAKVLDRDLFPGLYLCRFMSNIFKQLWVLIFSKEHFWVVVTTSVYSSEWYWPTEARIVVISGVSKVYMTLSKTLETSFSVKVTSWCSVPMNSATCLAAIKSGEFPIPMENDWKLRKNDYEICLEALNRDTLAYRYLNFVW